MVVSLEGWVDVKRGVSSRTCEGCKGEGGVGKGRRGSRAGLKWRIETPRQPMRLLSGLRGLVLLDDHLTLLIVTSPGECISHPTLTFFIAPSKLSPPYCSMKV